MDPCVFCRIVAGTEPAEIIHSDDASVAFLDITQATEGHTLVVPRRHRTDLTDIAPEEAASVMSAAVRVSHRLRERLRAPGINLWHASGETAWQSVFHFHVHVVPRYTPTDLVPPWSGPEGSVESLRALGAKLR
ncbi:HIT family protein [Thermomonospora umbrina]|uniref:Histidine triad (HIT) family protein n=1 Tax=Thermomonospora umbrina TaxID=111806 RepID=A0A3D9SM72_9ACTN|nr:HIT domain-containing protein [Thermomonospora umbrina]REE97022.1 histidine triad (HIT) family protein [Thermomonospora umbrina]